MEKVTSGQNEDIHDEVARILEDTSLNETDKIRALHQLGFTRKQLINDLAFPRSTVYYVLPAKPEEEEKDYNSKPLPVTVKGGEVITPESIMYRLTNGSHDWELRVEGMMLLRAAQKMVRDDVEIMRMQAEAEAKLIEPILKLMKETRAEQDAAAERARGASMDIAREAAAATAEQVAAYFDQKEQKKPDIATTPDPIKGVMARALETMMERVTGKMFGGGAQTGQAQLPPGWVDSRQPSAAGAGTAEPGSGQMPPGWSDKREQGGP